MEPHLTPPKTWDIKSLTDFNTLSDDDKIQFVNNVIEQKAAVAHQAVVLEQNIQRNNAISLLPTLLKKLSAFALNLIIIYLIFRFAPELFAALKKWIEAKF